MRGSQEAVATAAIAAYIDIGLLARAECLVASNSGFSNTAWLLGGGKPCIADLTLEPVVKWRQHTPCSYV